VQGNWGVIFCVPGRKTSTYASLAIPKQRYGSHLRYQRIKRAPSTRDRGVRDALPREPLTTTYAQGKVVTDPVLAPELVPGTSSASGGA
jgi:hypothetical protein